MLATKKVCILSVAQSGSDHFVDEAVVTYETEVAMVIPLFEAIGHNTGIIRLVHIVRETSM